MALRGLHLAVAGSLVMLVAGGGLFWYAGRTATGPARGAVHNVTVGKGCEPADFTVPAGPATFVITNASDRTLEWEILDGVMVVAERENIAPGFKSDLTVKLRPGTFEITCGLLSNPRGRLVVTPSARSEAERATPPVTAFVGPLSEYKVYLVRQSSELVRAATELERAIAANDPDGAEAAWLAARLPYMRMEAVAGRYADLEAAINPDATYLEKREADPAFTGFHRIEYGLRGQGGTEGLAQIAARFATDVSTLKDRLRALQPAPTDLGDLAVLQSRRMAEEVTADARHPDTGPDETAARLDGIDKLVQILDPLVRAADPSVAERVALAMAAARGHPDAATLGELADALGGMNPAIGLGP